MQPRTIITNKQFNLTIDRLCYELIENHNDFSNSALVSLQPRGVYLGNRVHQKLMDILGCEVILHGNLDATFFRDDFRRRKQPLSAKETDIDFIIEDKKVVLIDDVLFTGRTIRAGLDALLSFGRPLQVELMVLVDRRFSRHLPIQPDYIGKTVDSITSERVTVKWTETDGEDKVILFTPKDK